MVKTNHIGLMVQLHSDVVVTYIESFGTETQKRRYLPGCVTGDLVVLVAKDPSMDNAHNAVSLYLIEADNPVLKKTIDLKN